jgi:hypothetical protein
MVRTLGRAGIAELVERDAVAFFGAAQWQGQSVVRASVYPIATTTAEVDTSIAAVADAWRQVRAR